MILQQQFFVGISSLVLLSTSLLAQFPTKPGTVEISIYGGGSFDFPGASAAAGGWAFVVPGTPFQLGAPQFTRGGKTLPVLGGELGVALTRFLWVYGDYGYMFNDRNEASAQIPVFGGGVSGTTVPLTNSAIRKYWTATGGAEFSFPTVHRIVPFARVGGGYVHHSYNFNWPALNGRVGNVNYSDPGIQIVKADNIPAVTFGVGVRWYWREGRGLRIMADGFRFGHGIDDVAVAEGSSRYGYEFIRRRNGGRITVGYFFHFGR